jgi:hypothetical protein
LAYDSDKDPGWDPSGGASSAKAAHQGSSGSEDEANHPASLPKRRTTLSRFVEEALLLTRDILLLIFSAVQKFKINQLQKALHNLLQVERYLSQHLISHQITMNLTD